MRIHHSDLYHMRGSGIGSVFSSIFRTLVPIAKSIFGFTTRAAASPIGQQVMRAAKRSAVKAGIDLAQDTLAGENVGKSIKKRAKQAGRQVLEDLEAGRGRSKAAVKKKPCSSKPKKQSCKSGKSGKSSKSGKSGKTSKAKKNKKDTKPKKKKDTKKKKATASPGWMLQKLGL